MNDIVVSALLTVGGMLGVAIVTSVVQWRVTKALIASEHTKALAQVQREAALRATRQRRALLHEVLAELLSTTDPQINERIDERRMVPLIYKAQLLLNRDESNERALIGGLDRLVVAIRRSVGEQNLDPQEIEAAMLGKKEQIALQQAELMKLAHTVLFGYAGSDPGESRSVGRSVGDEGSKAIKA